MAKATFAAGCFWGVEETFRNLPGVTATSVGYTGGSTENPTYEDVCSSRTGHAEAVEVDFDPERISFENLLDVFWEAHDPTTLNRQGPDFGTQYRSAIFYHTPAQKATAEQVIRELTAAHLWEKPIVTEVTPFSAFYRAETYHQQYFQRNPEQPYCQFVIAPKVATFRKKFLAKLK